MNPPSPIPDPFQYAKEVMTALFADATPWKPLNISLASSEIVKEIENQVAKKITIPDAIVETGTTKIIQHISMLALGELGLNEYSISEDIMRTFSCSAKLGEEPPAFYFIIDSPEKEITEDINGVTLGIVHAAIENQRQAFTVKKLGESSYRFIIPSTERPITDFHETLTWLSFFSKYIEGVKLELSFDGKTYEEATSEQGNEYINFLRDIISKRDEEIRKSVKGETVDESYINYLNTEIKLTSASLVLEGYTVEPLLNTLFPPERDINPPPRNP